MNEPTAEQLAKLPKWAQEHISNITRQRDQAKATLARIADEQTPSPFYVDDWYSEPQIKRYIQCPQGRITIEHAGTHLEVFLAPKDDGQRLFGIELSWSAIEHGKRRLCSSEVAVHPKGFNTLQLVHCDNLH